MKKRILFVQEGRTSEESTVEDPSRGILAHPGLGYVAASARAAGHEVAVLDAMRQGLDVREVARRAADFRPDIVGFTAPTGRIRAVATTAEAIRHELPRAVIVVGGYHPSPLPERTLREFPVFDVAVVGEGEHAMVDLAARLDDRDSWRQVPGLWARRKAAIEHGPVRPMLRELDTLPFPAFDLFQLDAPGALYATSQDGPSLTLTTARGCPYRCVFCQNPMGRGYRPRSVESVVEEIEWDLKTYGARRLLVTDETFTLSRTRTEKLCEAMISRGLGKRVAWSCITRADAVDLPLLRQLRAAGCDAIFFGVESGDPEILAATGKKMLLERNIEAVRWSREAGLFTHVNVILGLPGETRKSALRTISAALKVDSDACGFNVLVPWPGTPVFEMAERGEHGMRLLTEDWGQFAVVAGGALELDTLSRRELELLQLYGYARFYLRPSKIRNLPRVGDLRAIPNVLVHMARKQLALLRGTR